MLQGEHSAILSTFIKLSFVIKIFVLSIFERPFYTGLLYIKIYFWYFSFPVTFSICLNVFYMLMHTYLVGAAVRSKAVVLLLSIHCLFLLPYFVYVVLCMVFVLLCSTFVVSSFAIISLR